ncbi:hypothetical protein [uncultured Parabacteroides sp.]|uniref:hypothetical protein n=1 Tax=uncultured Parabacteroides sp. TaxID=512312 RepID=UPI00261D2025|nr:hypothetical protein [uncultured Parabacteroides sp.]
MKLLGIVFLYYPDNRIIDNINTYLSYVDTLILWKNSSLDIDLSLLVNKNWLILGNEQNWGIGKPLNYAVSYAFDNGYTHLLTMDQDSSFVEGDFVKYLEYVTVCPIKQVGCFSPNMDFNMCRDEKNVYRRLDVSITSGSIYPISVFSKVGLFKEEYFIDAIDTEFCFRLRSFNYDIVEVTTVYMKHLLGNKTIFKIFSIQFSSINYSPMRTYYTIRNHYITNKQYPQYTNIISFYKFFLFRRFLQILMLEPNKKSKIKAMCYGFLHGLQGRLGKFLYDK